MDLIQSIWGWFLAQGLFIQITIGLGVLAGLTIAVILIGIGIEEGQSSGGRYSGSSSKYSRSASGSSRTITDHTGGSGSASGSSRIIREKVPGGGYSDYYGYWGTVNVYEVSPDGTKTWIGTEEVDGEYI